MAHAGGGFVVTAGTGGDPDEWVCVEDKFDRVVNSGWGSAGMGLEWKPNVTNPVNLGAYSVHDGYAQFNPQLSQGPGGGDDGMAMLPNQVPSGVVEITARFSVIDTTTEAEYYAGPQFYIARHRWGLTYTNYYYGVDCWFDYTGGSYVKVLSLPGFQAHTDITPPPYGAVITLWARWEGGRVTATVSWGATSYSMVAGDTDYVFPAAADGEWDTFYLYVPNTGQSIRVYDFKVCSQACAAFPGAPPIVIPPVSLGNVSYSDRVLASSWKYTDSLGIVSPGTSPYMTSTMDHSPPTGWDNLQYGVSFTVPTGCTRARVKGTVFWNQGPGETGSADWQLIRGAWGTGRPASWNPGGTTLASGNLVTGGSTYVIDIDVPVVAGTLLEMYLTGQLINGGGSDVQSNVRIPAVAGGGGLLDFLVQWWNV